MLATYASRAFLAVLLGSTVLFGCAAPADDPVEDDDSALRAIRKDDVDIELLGSTPTLGAPAKFADVASWSVDYVEMKDADPSNAYRGLMLFARNAKGEPLYLLPFGWSGADAMNACHTEASKPWMLPSPPFTGMFTRTRPGP